ncbi:hypothetical protein F5146DRAFT_319918 [Armillaria mellea]|nr:hypothetical protein F5146DRAFT_319918 [Armillaria mellea]
MTGRNRYQGTYRKVVIAFDVGTTFSGASYAILDPGLVPEVRGVTRFPAQQKVGGDSKIPSIIYYNKAGVVRAVGAEATQEAFLEEAEDEEYIKVEWFKLHLRPKTLAASHISDADIPPLPRGKKGIDVLSDFLRYLFECTRNYIIESNPSGANFWESVKDNVEFVLTHPNGWEGPQQAIIRRAAVFAGLIPDAPHGQARLQFVTEGEASLHFCINKGALGDLRQGDGIIIVDAGGGTVDLSAYGKTSDANTFEEIAATQCRLHGSVFVGRHARAYLEDELSESKFKGEDDINQIASVFDKTTKLGFRSDSEPQFIRFGSARDKDLSVGIRNGQMRIAGNVVATFFEPSVKAIIEAVTDQMREASRNVSTIVLVGGFAASDWLFSQLQQELGPRGLSICRPDGHVNKAVADGALSFYLDHFVSARVANFTYGIECVTDYQPSNSDHLKRSSTIIPMPSGRSVVPHTFSPILTKGARVQEEKEFVQKYWQEGSHVRSMESLYVDLMCYRGPSPAPQWIDLNPNMFSTLCTVQADTSGISQDLAVETGRGGQRYYSIKFDVVLLFGLTELKAQLQWVEDVSHLLMSHFSVNR